MTINSWTNYRTHTHYLPTFDRTIITTRYDLTSRHTLTIRETREGEGTHGETIGTRDLILSTYNRTPEGGHTIRETRYSIGETFRDLPRDLPLIITGRDFTLGGQGDFTLLGTRTYGDTR